MALMWLRAEIKWLVSRRYRDEQVAALRHVFPETVLDDRAIRQAARRSGLQSGRRAEMVWRPWLNGTLDVTGAASIREAQAAGRHVIVVLLHQGGFQDVPPSLVREGVPLAVVAARHYFSTPNPGFSGYRDRRYALNAIQSGITIISSGQMVEPVADALARGQAVTIAWDIHGRHPVEIYGRTVYVQPGVARIARLHKALVFPVALHRGRGPFGSRAEVQEPFDAAEYERWQDLLQAMVDRGSDHLLTFPESVEWPRERWLLEPPPRGWRPQA